MKEIESICVFGDSTSWGAWDMEKGGWFNRLWLFAAERQDENYRELYNLGISGGTTSTILERFENEAKIRNADALLFQTGGNDASVQNGEHKIASEKFRENLIEIIKRAKTITENIAFIDLRNCDESKTTPVSWADINYTNDSLEQYSAVMEGVCKEQGVSFIQLPVLTNDEFEDGIHPNAQGHQKIFETIKEWMLESKWL